LQLKHISTAFNGVLIYQ